MNKKLKICKKCDERGMIADSKYSSHSCDCGKDNLFMKTIFSHISIGKLFAYGRGRVKQKTH